MASYKIKILFKISLTSKLYWFLLYTSHIYETMFTNNTNRIKDALHDCFAHFIESLIKSNFNYISNFFFWS
jgi:hypothetical protein